jgi:two-component system LytT family response regulator
MKIRALIVDDEPLARRGVRDLLAMEEDVEVVGESADGLRAIEDLQSLAPDLVFLDVQMPGLDGFEVLESIDPERMPAVVFTTAHDAHALRAFDAHAVDYLLKPLDPERFRAALARAREVLMGRTSGEVHGHLRALLAATKSVRPLERLLVRSAGGLTIVPLGEIDWIEADGDYARLHTRGRQELLRETLQSLETRLDPSAWARIHRSYIVRIDRVRQVKTLENGDGAAILEGGVQLPVSRTHREALLRALRGTEA